MDKVKDIPASIIFLFAAIIVYGLFGSPTPNDPGIVEAVVGGLLVLSIGASGLSKAADITLERTGYIKALQILFLSGLILPTISGVYFGNDRMMMLRDVAAFAFLALPLFLSERFAGREEAARWFSWLLVLTGIAFALRTLMPAFNIWIPQGELLYLSNSPVVMFAAIFLACNLWERSQKPFTGIGVSVAMLAGLAVLTGAMLLDVQRATVGAVILSVLILAVIDLVRAPKTVILPFTFLIIFIAVLYPVLGDALHAMAKKTSEVGLNARIQEAQAVYESLTPEPAYLFVGKGWGAVFSSPAVAGLEVNYTHSLLTTMAMKGGIIMLLLTLMVAGAALQRIYLVFQRDRGEGLSLFWPLVIPVLLYASHKSLDFGLLLLLIGVWSIPGRPLHKSHTSCKKKEHSNEPNTGKLQA